jgi:hypothetical protein
VLGTTKVVAVTVTPAAMDVGADDRVQATKKMAASRTKQLEVLTQSTYRGVVGLSDRVTAQIGQVVGINIDHYRGPRPLSIVMRHNAPQPGASRTARPARPKSQ